MFGAQRWTRSPGFWVALVFTCLAAFWGANTSGLVSSNDGSHLALARALGIHGRTHLGDEVALTLSVDLATRGGRDYSDRPPGTAFLALGSLLLGHAADPALLRASRSRKQMLVRPAAEPYARTYYGRATTPPFLVGMMGSILAVCLHSMVVSLLGFACLWQLLRRRGLSPQGCAFVVLALGLGSLWGPYATVFFSHATAAALVSAFLLGIDCLPGDSPPPVRASAESSDLSHRDRLCFAWVGLLGAWIVATDYLLLLVVVPLLLIRQLSCPGAWRPGAWRGWAWLVLGALPIVLAVLVYHDCAFGHPLSLGYDHHGNFAFARARRSTFDGSFVEGFWMQWGLGGGAGLLAQAPIALAGLVGALTGGLTVGRARGQGRRRRCLMLLAWLPWIVLIAMHRTPTGGVGADHRYLIPLMPVAGIGLGWAWWRAEASRLWQALLWRSLLVALAFFSAARVWSHFFAWHEATWFESPATGVSFALLVLLVLFLVATAASAIASKAKVKTKTKTKMTEVNS